MALRAPCTRAIRRAAVATASMLALAAAHAAPAPGELAEHERPRPVPEIAFTDGEGAGLTLADFRGRVVVLNVWATWCPPCRAEMPTLDRLQAELGGPRFEVVALSVDRAGPAVVRTFYEEEGIERLSLYIDPSMRSMPRLGVVGIPTTLVLDPRGREIARAAGEADWATPEMLAYFRDLIGAATQRVSAGHR